MRFFFVLAVLLALAIPALAQNAPPDTNPAPNAEAAEKTQWASAPLVDWNAGVGEIPRAPAGHTAEGEWERCSSVRRPDNANEKAIVAAGWHLSGVARSFAKLSVVRVASGLDEMCHPTGFQSFAFQGKQFLGALSPVPMNTRAEGELNAVLFPAESHIIVDAHGYAVDGYFSHYVSGDAACCPSQTIVVHYVLAGAGGSLHLAPKAASLFRNSGR